MGELLLALVAHQELYTWVLLSNTAAGSCRELKREVGRERVSLRENYRER